MHGGLDPRPQSERLVLRHVDLRTDHIALHDGEHERAPRGIGLHEVTHVDVALSDDSVERRNDALIGLLLAQDQELRRLRRHVGFRNAPGSLLRLKSEAVDIALLRGDPTFADQGAVPLPRHLCETPVRLRLLNRRLELAQRGLRLHDLVIELRSRDLRQQLPFPDAVADIDVALVDVAARASKDVRRRECRRRAR